MSDYLLFLIFIPLAVGINAVKNKRWRNGMISVFVLVWLSFFSYETFRGFQLKHVLKKDLPKTKFLFPPAGWIMFYQVGQTSGFYEVYGMKGQKPQLIDPHDIFRTRTIGYDNIHRGILGSAAQKGRAQEFCRFLKYRFEEFDAFVVLGVYLPDPAGKPYERKEQVQYQCAY